jgi:ankyrin repeat protein
VLTPLYDTIEEKHDVVIRLLLGAGKFDMVRKQYKGFTPLNYVSEADNEAAVCLFLERYDNYYLDVDSKNGAELCCTGWLGKYHQVTP